MVQGLHVDTQDAIAGLTGEDAMDIKKYLRDNGVAFTMDTHAPQFTAQEVAAAEHVPGREVAKVVVLKVDDRFVMAVLPAPKLVEVDKVATLLNAGQVRFADETEMHSLFPDAEVGAEPPFGNLYGLEVLVDRNLAMQEHIVFQSGSHRETVRIRYADYERLVQPRVEDFAMSAEPAVAKA